MGSTYVRIKKNLVYALLLTAAILPAQKAHASITGVTTTPSSRNVAINRTASVSITWRVTGPLVTFVSSPQGQFVNPIDATTLGIVNTPFTKTGLGGAGALAVTSSVSFNEQLLVPASIIAKARSLGLSQIVYRRFFSDSGMQPGGGSITLNITGSAGAGFNISREALSFTDK